MKKARILPAIKKDVKYFLLSEEARMSKKNIAKLGFGLTMLGFMLDTQVVQGHDSSYLNDANKGYHSSHGSHGSHTSHGSHSAHASHASHGSHSAGHASHTSHASHGSHSNHSQGGWC